MLKNFLSYFLLFIHRWITFIISLTQNHLLVISRACFNYFLLHTHINNLYFFSKNIREKNEKFKYQPFTG